VTRKSVVSKPGMPHPQRVTVADLEKAGLVHLRPPPPGRVEHWATTWNVTQKDLVMELPFVLAQAALLATSDCHEHPRDEELFTGARRVLAHLYPNASSFEQLALEHRVLRHNVASEWARRRRRNYVEARDLFCGTICDPSLTKLRFAQAPKVRRLSPPAVGVWWNAAAEGRRGKRSKVPTSIALQNGTTVELLQPHSPPYAILLSGPNAVDGLLNEQLHPLGQKVLPAASIARDCAHSSLSSCRGGGGGGGGGQEVLIYIDTAKHAQIGARSDDALSYGDDIKALIEKRCHLARQFPDAEHILVITSNKRAQQQMPDGQSHTAATLLRSPSASGATPSAPAADPRTCLITATDDSLAWAMSPTFAHFLV
jgi:hypothetical protein